MKQIKKLDVKNAQPLTRENMKNIYGGGSSLDSCAGAFCRVNSDCSLPCQCNQAIFSCHL